jgi:hypothetical protein
MTGSRAMTRVALLAFLLALSGPAAAAAAAPLHDTVSLNIGLNCQWQQRCIEQQYQAMKRALAYVRKAQPASWRIQQCNRNAARRRNRVDWVGFDNCIRNMMLRAPARAPLKRGRKYA